MMSVHVYCMGNIVGKSLRSSMWRFAYKRNSFIILYYVWDLFLRFYVYTYPINLNFFKIETLHFIWNFAKSIVGTCIIFLFSERRKVRWFSIFCRNFHKQNLPHIYLFKKFTIYNDLVRILCVLFKSNITILFPFQVIGHNEWRMSHTFRERFAL